MLTDDNLQKALECLLFVATKPLKLSELKKLLEVDEPELEAAVANLKAAYSCRGLHIVEVAGGLRLCTRPEYYEYVKRLQERSKPRLSQAALETLAIIAYKQPVTRAEIENIRGVNIKTVLYKLLQWRLIKPSGRKEVAGRPLLYCTTDKFLIHFGLKSLSELPPVESF